MNSWHGDDDLKHDIHAAGSTGSVRFVAAAFAVCAFVLGSLSPALAEKRTLKLFNTHTHETVSITFKKNGKFIPSALRELNRFLRDWRRNEATKMDPELFDLVWDVYRKSGAKKPIHVVSAYRSPATNNMLRSRSRGVARNSQHTRGKAMDFFIPGVSIKKLRANGLRKEVGGVGYYPKSRSPFVHMDTGRVRHWPRMTRRQLASVFPNGKTIHVPSDGKPMPRYKQALAAVNKRDARNSNPRYVREQGNKRKRTKPIRVAKREKPAATKTAKKTPKPVTVASNVVSDDDKVITKPGTNLLSGIASRFANRNSGKTPPGNIPNKAKADGSKPSAQSDVAPGVESEPAAKPEEPEAIVIATRPLSKPERSVPTLGDNATLQVAEVIAGDTPESQSTEAGAEAGFVLASADTTEATLPPVGQTAAQPAFATAENNPAATSGNPNDFVVASLPPATRTRSFGQSGDAVAAAGEIIRGTTPQARPLVPITEPLAYATVGSDNPVRKPILQDRNIVGAVPKLASQQAASKPKSEPLRVAALNPSTSNAVARTPPARVARAMPIIGDLKSLLDTQAPFESASAFGRLLKTDTTTRTLVFADLRHPEVTSISTFMQKPQRVLKRTFGQGFQSELRTDRFTGAAVGVIKSIFTP